MANGQNNPKEGKQPETPWLVTLFGCFGLLCLGAAFMMGLLDEMLDETLGVAIPGARQTFLVGLGFLGVAFLLSVLRSLLAFIMRRRGK